MKEQTIQRFKDAKYGLMAHWGLYSLLAGEYKGEPCRPYAEWIQSRFRIPNAVNEKLAKSFNPILFDADEWILFAKECGMKYFVITAKHHEGFAMYRSKCDKYNIYDATPFKRDVVKELALACERHGLAFGLYYSQDLDWHEQHGGGYKTPGACAGTTWDNSWDFPDRSQKNFDICFETKILPQVEELMTGYGDIFTLWFDCPMTISEKQSKILRQVVKKYQPECLISSRIGNGMYDYVELGDNEIPDSLEPGTAEVDYNDFNGFKPSEYGLYESSCTLNDTWGYSANDYNWKSSETIRRNRQKLNGMGINYLLNVGPDGLGRIPAKAQEIIKNAK